METRSLHIPKGAESGELFRIRGEGFPKLRGHGKGDQIVQSDRQNPKESDEETGRIAQGIRGDLAKEERRRGLQDLFQMRRMKVNIIFIIRHNIQVKDG